MLSSFSWSHLERVTLRSASMVVYVIRTGVPPQHLGTVAHKGASNVASARNIPNAEPCTERVDDAG